MEKNIKQDKDKSKKEFEKLLSQDLGNRKLKENEIITGVVSSISKKHVFIDIMAKSEGCIPISEFEFMKTADKIKVGAKVEVLLEKIENKFGDIVISAEKARRANSWKKMEKAYEANEQVKGNIVSRVKGGFAVDLNGFLAFLPGSQLSTKPLSNDEIHSLMKEEQTFEVCKLDKRRNNLVLSRRQVQQRSMNKNRAEKIEKLKEGMIIEDAVVKALTPWGAFILVNDLETLCHINEISYSRIESPSELLSIGQKLRVKILKIDHDNLKVSTTIKRLFEDPYDKAIEKYDVGTDKDYDGVVSSIQDYGAFIKLSENLIGLCHSSECDWLNPKIHPSKILSVSQKVKVRILDIDKEKRRISLSYKRTMPNPWDEFCKKYKVDSIVKATVRSKSEFGLFCEIMDTSISGLCHYKDLDYSEKSTELDKYKKNDILEFKLVEINKEQQKVRLSKKLTEKDPFSLSFSSKKVSDIVTCTVDSVSKNGIYIYLGQNRKHQVLIKKRELARESDQQRISRFVPGSKIDCEITELDQDKRKVTLSIKALEDRRHKDILQKFGSTDSGGVLGDILKPILKKDKNKKKD